VPLSCHACSSSSRQSTESFAALDLAPRLFTPARPMHARRSPFFGGGGWRWWPPACLLVIWGSRCRCCCATPPSSLQASSAAGSNTSYGRGRAIHNCRCVVCVLLSIESRITLPRDQRTNLTRLARWVCCCATRRGFLLARMWACLSPQQPDLSGRGRCPNIARGTERGCGPERARSHRPGAHGRHSHTAAAAASAHTQRRRRPRDESC